MSKGMIKDNDIKIIWWSPLIPNSPFCATKSLPEDMKEAFKTALLDFEKNDPQRFKKVVEGMFGGFAEANHDMYQYAIDIRERQKRERN
jgi:phosphonate transport system substrate-binding protein